MKGLLGKAREGIYPSFARVGYLNSDGPAGKRIIVIGPDTGPVITEMYLRFETDRYSVRALAAEFRGQGVTLHGRKISSSLVHQILRSRLYMGDFSSVTAISN